MSFCAKPDEKIFRSLDNHNAHQVCEAGLEVEVAPLEDEDGEDVADDADGAADRQQETLEPEERLRLCSRSEFESVA